jgi:hypothetical protein
MKEEIIEKVVKKLLERGMEQAVAEDRTKKVYEKLMDENNISEYTDSRIEHILYTAVSSSIKGSSKGAGTTNSADVEEIVGVCIGFDQKQDEAEWLKRANLKYAEKVYADTGDYKSAINEGFIEYILDDDGEIEYVNDKPVIRPLDNREFIDKAQTMVNYNKGKEFVSRFSRYAYFIIDGAVRTVKGDINPVIGTEYKIFTKNSNGKVIFTTNAGIVGIAPMSNTQLWDYVLQYADGFEESTPLNEIEEKKEHDLIVTIGDVIGKPTTKGHKPFLLLCNDDCEENVSAFTRFNDDIIEYLDDINECNEVIVVGKVQNGYDKYGKSIAIMGIVRNPETDEVASIANKLGGMFDDE